jgi:hypothetical protein
MWYILPSSVQTQRGCGVVVVSRRYTTTGYTRSTRDGVHPFRRVLRRDGLIMSSSGSARDGDGERPLFADFIAENVSAEERVDALIERTSGVLKEAAEALARVRRDSGTSEGGSVKMMEGGRGNGVVHSAGKRPAFLKSSGGSGSGGGSGHSSTSINKNSSNTSKVKGVFDTDDGGSLDGWFYGKVEAGSLLPPQRQQQQKEQQKNGVSFKEKVDGMPESLTFGKSVLMGLDAPEESVKGSERVFPESLSLRFQSDLFSVQKDESVVNSASQTSKAEDSATTMDTEQGEEFGPNGLWKRWTEHHGRDATGTVTWTERWWEISDWSGMKELGAEKYGMNASGDVWRETWTEKIVMEELTRKPMISRSAHKWARASGGQEWEEKWSETYWSGGMTDKWADKWGKDGDEVWHETWGETYDGAGGCVKWTDRWAEKLDQDTVVQKWGDKWREEFKDGVGEKSGETWVESLGNEAFQRWWGEKHLGNGQVQKYGNSTSGEHWDVTETMDTYYNPIPHFGYDLALSHSPQLNSVPMLPRDEVLE